MNFLKAEENNNAVRLVDIKRFELADILNNGQCFRWNEVKENHYSGIALGRKLELIRNGDDLIIEGTNLQEFEDLWKNYFDLSRDYDQIVEMLSGEVTMEKATAYAPGLRVLRQEPWEALASFILSQNNNIKRIKGLVERYAENFGTPIEGGFAFPTVEQVAGITVDDLAPVRAGFRSKYLVDAARKVADGQVSLTLPYTMEIDEAREHLMQIKGVGPKVANCVLLFGFGRIEALPVDVWVKRAFEKFYPDGLPQEFASVAGLAQQYLFHYTRFLEE